MVKLTKIYYKAIINKFIQGIAGNYIDAKELLERSAKSVIEKRLMMNRYERMIYDKYAYKKTYIYLVYEEFERRVNATTDEYEGLKVGECRFDYKSWENRLNISHKSLVNTIKILISESVIKQVLKGIKGVPSIYYLMRFEQKIMEQNIEQKKEQKKEQNKHSKKEGLTHIVEQNIEQENEQKRVQSSIYNNPNIISNNINSSSKDENKITKKEKTSTKSKDFKFKSKEYEEAFKEIWSLYPNRKGTTVAKAKINKLLDTISKDELIRCVKRYNAECIKEKREIQFIKHGSTFFNVAYEDYLDINYQKDLDKLSKGSSSGGRDKNIVATNFD